MVVSEVKGRTSRCDNSLPNVLLVCHASDGEWTLSDYLCPDASLISSYYVGGTRALLIENEP
jgi:hypothetical protein